MIISSVSIKKSLNLSSYVLNTVCLSLLFVLFTLDVWILKVLQWLKFQKRRVDAESEEGWWWAVEEYDSEVRLALGAFTSLVILLFVIGFESCVIDVVECDIRVLLFDDFDSIFNSSPKSGKTCFRFVFGIEWKESCIANNTMIKSSLILRPEHTSEWSFHGFGFDKESLMWGQFESLSFIWCLPNKVFNQMRFHYRSVEDWCAFFKIFMLPHFVQNRKLVSINYSVH